MRGQERGKSRVFDEACLFTRSDGFHDRQAVKSRGRGRTYVDQCCSRVLFGTLGHLRGCVDKGMGRHACRPMRATVEVVSAGQTKWSAFHVERKWQSVCEFPQAVP